MSASFEYFARLRARVETRLGELVDVTGSYDRLNGSVCHSLLAPAKRVRAVLTLITARELAGGEDGSLDLACALEMIHAASLILDDLPAMDDAEIRRGLPANHRVFGDATAILAAVGLLNRAYGVAAASESLSADQRVAVVEVMHWAVGFEGLVRGQHDDLDDSRSGMTQHELERVYARKTGALFAAAAECGAIAAGRPGLRAAMRRFGLDLGVGFQVLDDVLDARGTLALAGKDVAQDKGSTTFTSLLGVNGAIAFGKSKIDNALNTARAAAHSAGSEGDLFQIFATRLAGAFSDLVPEFRAEIAVNG